MDKNDLGLLYMKKNIDSVHDIYKDVEFLSREIPNPTIDYIKEALEELEQNMRVQIHNLKND